MIKELNSFVLGCARFKLATLRLATFSLSTLILSTLIFALAFPASANATSPSIVSSTSSTSSASSDEDKGIEDNRTFHIYDDVDLVSTLKFEYGKSRIIIKSVYPQLVSETSETEHQGIQGFNDLSLSIVKEEISKFRNLVKEQAPFQKQMEKKSVTNNLYIDYNTSYMKSKNDHIISIRFSVQANISGLKTPYHEHVVLNYDLDKSQQIELSDLFIPGSDYLDALSQYATYTLAKRFANKNIGAGYISAQAENFQAWNIKPNGLLITLSENQIASNAVGAQTILIPYSILGEFISPDSPIIYCVKHKERCARNNLLTGGFIDEAINTRHSRLNPILGKL
jgi:hypothetical protein